MWLPRLWKHTALLISIHYLNIQEKKLHCVRVCGGWVVGVVTLYTSIIISQKKKKYGRQWIILSAGNITYMGSQIMESRFHLGLFSMEDCYSAACSSRKMAAKITTVTQTKYPAALHDGYRYLNVSLSTRWTTCRPAANKFHFISQLLPFITKIDGHDKLCCKGWSSVPLLRTDSWRAWCFQKALVS